VWPYPSPSARDCGELPDTVLFRYEDRFASSPRTVPGLAQLLGVKVPAERLTEIAQTYSAAGVRAYADRLDHPAGPDARSRQPVRRLVPDRRRFIAGISANRPPAAGATCRMRSGA
jgi:hypothetical protein